MAVIEFWVGTLVAVVSAVLGGTGTAAWIKARAARKDRRLQGTSEDIRACQDVLAKLRNGYRLRSQNAPAAPDDNELALLEDELDKQAHRTGCVSVTRHARLYRDTGRSYASGDPEVGEGAEEESYDRLADSLMEELNRNR